ncbi:MAG: hypothetical protein MUC88_28800 [Planctomycetes bacterium]|jgi:hypothetical protein|nr:hypothetical protein [Planctomycetota bacterium]
MPITALFSCCALFGVLLLIPLAPASVTLLLMKKKRAALAALCVPVGMIALSVLVTVLVFAAAQRHSRIMSGDPQRLFEVTFGFSTPPGTSVVEAHHESIMDYGTTVLRFRTTQEVINLIASHNFARIDKETFLRAYQSNDHNLPDDVRSWFLPAGEADQFYLATEFDTSFGTSEAALCYCEMTQTAYFHWVGVD